MGLVKWLTGVIPDPIRTTFLTAPKFSPWLNAFQQLSRRYFWWLKELEIPAPGLLHIDFEFYTIVNELLFSASCLP